MGFKCFHCGHCCQSVVSQINLTVGDVIRMSEHLGKPVSELVPAYIGIKPFADPQSDVYELGLGLHIPCKLHKNDSCTIHAARPLNCRFFPLWIIGNVPLNNIKEVIDDKHRCMVGMFDKSDQEKAKKYVHVLAKVFHNESTITDEMLSFLPKKEVRLQDYEGHEEFLLSIQSWRNEKERDRAKIEWLMARIPAYPELATKILECSSGAAALAEITRLEEEFGTF